MLVATVDGMRIAAIAVALLIGLSGQLGGDEARHERSVRVRWRTGVVFGLVAMAGACAPGRLARPTAADVLPTAFGLTMFATVFAMPELVAQSLRRRELRPQDLPLARVLVEAMIGGAVSGLVGAGGGFPVVPALALLGGLPIELPTRAGLPATVAGSAKV